MLFKVGCEAGTYIRKLCFDVGEVLGCGAHMQELRRTRSGPFVETGSVILHDLAYSFMEWQEKENDEMLRRFIQPVEQGLVLTPKIYIRDTAVDAVCHGASLAAPGVLSLESGITKESAVALLSLKGEAVALGRALASTEQIFDMEHGFVASTERVLMQRGTYPKRWKTGEKENDQKK